MNSNQLYRYLGFTLFIPLILSVMSTCFILHEIWGSVSLDLTINGFNSFTRIFAFPISIMGVFITLSAIFLILKQLQQTEKANLLNQLRNDLSKTDDSIQKILNKEIPKEEILSRLRAKDHEYPKEDKFKKALKLYSQMGNSQLEVIQIIPRFIACGITEEDKIFHGDTKNLTLFFERMSICLSKIHNLDTEHRSTQHYANKYLKYMSVLYHFKSEINKNLLRFIYQHAANTQTFELSLKGIPAKQIRERDEDFTKFLIQKKPTLENIKET